MPHIGHPLSRQGVSLLSYGFTVCFLIMGLKDSTL